MASFGLIVNHPEHAKSIAKAAGTYFNPECDICISRESDGELVGGVIFQNFTGESIGVHVAGFVPNWLNRDLLWMAFDYPFNQLKCKRIFSQIPETNTKSLAFNRKLGFKEVAKIDGVFRDGAVVVTCIGKDDCKWHNMKPPGMCQDKELLDG